MAQHPPPHSSGLPSATISSIDAAVAAILNDDPSTNSNVDIVGTAVALSNGTMDRVELMMNKLRCRGRRLRPSRRPLTVDRPFARQLPSPPTMTAISPVYPTAQAISPEPRTAFSLSPVSPISRKKLSNVPSKSELATGRERSVSPLITHQKNTPTRTGRERTPKSDSQNSSGYPTALSPATPPHPASRRQSISNVVIPSTRTGRESSQHSPCYRMGITPTTPPSSRRKTARGVSPLQLRTGRERSGSNSSQRSSGYPTALSPATPPLPASRRQSISNVQIPSTRTGLDVTPPKRDAKTYFVTPQLATGHESSERSTKTGREASQRSPATPSLPASRRQSISNVLIPSTRPRLVRSPLQTGRELSQRSSDQGSFSDTSAGGSYASDNGLRTARALSPYSGSPIKDGENKPVLTPAQQWSNVKPGRGPKICPAKSPVLNTARELKPKTRCSGTSQRESKHTPEKIWNDLVQASQQQDTKEATKPSGLLTARVAPTISPLPSREPLLTTARNDTTPPSATCKPSTNILVYSTRTGLEHTPLKSGREPSERSIRTGRDASQRSSGYPTALSPATPPLPASRRQSISNVYIPSTRTGLDVTPHRSQPGTPSQLATGHESSERSTRTGRETFQRLPSTPPSQATRRQSISDVRIPSTHTGHEHTPSESSFERSISENPSHRTQNSPSCQSSRKEPIVQQVQPAMGSFHASSPRSSVYPTALSPATPPLPASRRQSISNVVIPSTRTGLEVTPPRRMDQSHPAAHIGTVRDPSERSTRTGREASHHSPSTPRTPASRVHSISNVNVASTRTGLEHTPLQNGRDTPQNSPCCRTGIAQATSPISRRKTARGLSPLVTPPKSLLRTGRERTRSNSSQRSSGYPTALSPATPPLPASRRQSISNILIPSTRTGLDVTPPKRDAKNYFGTPSQLATAHENSERSTKTGREASQRSPASRRQSISNVLVSSTRTGLEHTPLKSGRETSERSIRTGRDASQHSSGYPTALSPSVSRDNLKGTELFPPLDPNLGQPITSQLGAPLGTAKILPPNAPVQSDEDGLDRVTIESSDSNESITSHLSVEINNTEPDPLGGRRRRRMRPKRILLNGEEVWSEKKNKKN